MSGSTKTGTATGILLTLFLSGCSDGGSGLDPSPSGDGCALDTRFVAVGADRGAIPQLTDPPLVSASADGARYLSGSDRVVGLIVDGQAYAVPHNILWWHEIVNLDVGSELLAVTFCPLTGSGLAFDRQRLNGWRLGVSGLVFKNNLVMFILDRPQAHGGDTGPESLFPQMLGRARCGPESEVKLTRYPVIEIRWDAWRDLHPSTLVISEETGHGRDYTLYPYGDYESLSNDAFLFPEIMPPPDLRRPLKERVVGVPPGGEDAGIAFASGLLDEAPGQYLVARFEYEGSPAVLLWSEGDRAGMAYRPRATDGRNVTLRSTEAGFEDEETRSVWSVDGRAVEGPMASARLEPLETTFVAFWGAWAAFFPETRLWNGT